MPFTGVAGGCAPSVLLCLLVLWAPALCHAAWSHNISAILAASPDLAQFSAALRSTGLAAKIDSLTTITVLAVDDVAMAPLLARRLPQGSLRNVLAMQVLVDYFDNAKLHSFAAGAVVPSTSLYQSSGEAQGSSGLVNVTLRQGGGVAFVPYVAAADVTPAVFYQKSVHESPYDIAVLQVSALISSPPADSPAPPEASPSPSPSPTPTPAPSPAKAPARVTAPAPAPGNAPSPAPAPAPAPVTAPAPAPGNGPSPSPAHHPAPPPKQEEAPAPAPDAEEPPADEGGQKKNGASGRTPSWSLVTAAAPAVALLLW